MTEDSEEAKGTLPVANKAPDEAVDTVLALAQRRDPHLVVEVLRAHERGYPLHELVSVASARGGELTPLEMLERIARNIRILPGELDDLDVEPSDIGAGIRRALRDAEAALLSN